MESIWLARAKRLNAIAATGLGFARDPFDRERYQEIAALAQLMLADLATVPIERITGLVGDFDTSYATPKLDIRAALIEDGKILLVRERSDGCWSLPGGFADIGLSAAQNAVKEMREETGVLVAATRLYGVRHKAKHAYRQDARDFYKLSFLCERRGEVGFVPDAEVTEIGFFAPDALPPLSVTRIIESDITAAFAAHADPLRPTEFD